MKRTGIILGLAASGLLISLAYGQHAGLNITAVHTLTPIDSIPTKDEILTLFPQNTVTELAKIAQDTEVDFGVRLRAIRALPQFCATSCAGSLPHSTLVQLLATTSLDQTGTGLLLLRATIEALGVAKSGDVNDVSRLTPFLENLSRDIRAATAFALRDLCNQNAVTPLRNRYNVELGPAGVPQVRLAISAALRDLGQCSP